MKRARLAVVQQCKLPKNDAEKNEKDNMKCLAKKSRNNDALAKCRERERNREERGSSSSS